MPPKGSLPGRSRAQPTAKAQRRNHLFAGGYAYCVGNSGAVDLPWSDDSGEESSEEGGESGDGDLKHVELVEFEKVCFSAPRAAVEEAKRRVLEPAWRGEGGGGDGGGAGGEEGLGVTGGALAARRGFRKARRRS